MSEWKDDRIESEHYGSGTPCSDCGDMIDEYAPEWAEYCHRHSGERPDPLVKSLEALVDEWREQRQDVLDMEKATRQGDLHAKGVACGIDYCVGELEEVLDE